MLRFLCSLAVLGPFASAQQVFETPRLPQAISSFGAARLGDALYVAGGHIGRAHAHSRENLTAAFRRLELGAPPTNWTELAPTEAVQGTALVAYGDRLYRLGGLTARNAAHEPEQLASLSSVACFDPALGAWEELTPLPEPRSSHDACVVGERVFVVGGWNLQPSGPVWLETTWSARLDQRPLRWEAMPALRTPRRAAALAAHGDHLVFVGGMTSAGVSSAVEWLRPFAADADHASAWTLGPELPGSGFGAAATTCGDRCFATSGDGALWELDREAQQWIARGRLAFPRIFHRLLPYDAQHVIAIGGADRSGHVATCEVLSITGELCFQRIAVDLPAGAGLQRAGVASDARSFTWLGGNRSTRAHRFEPDDFSNLATRVRWSDFEVEVLPDLPMGMQSFAAIALDKGRSYLALGGFGHVEGRPTSIPEAWTCEQDDEQWTAVKKWQLEPSRTQFAAHEFASKLWILGGLNYDEARGEDEAFRPQMEVLMLDLAQREQGWVDTGWRLPRPRRAAASARLGSQMHLIGGLGASFDAVDVIDVLDLESGAWTTSAAPRATRISAQAVEMGERIWLAGGSLIGGAEARALESFDPQQGWHTVIDELPFSVRHLELVARGGTLAFLRVEEATTPRLIVHLCAPSSVTGVPAFHR